MGPLSSVGMMRSRHPLGHRRYGREDESLALMAAIWCQITHLGSGKYWTQGSVVKQMKVKLKLESGLSLVLAQRLGYEVRRLRVYQNSESDLDSPIVTQD